jgi:hypothetical protein
MAPLWEGSLDFYSVQKQRKGPLGLSSAMNWQDPRTAGAEPEMWIGYRVATQTAPLLLASALSTEFTRWWPEGNKNNNDKLLKEQFKDSCTEVLPWVGRTTTIGFYS